MGSIYVATNHEGKWESMFSMYLDKETFSNASIDERRNVPASSNIVQHNNLAFNCHIHHI